MSKTNMTETRAHLAKQIAVARKAAEVLWDAVHGWDLAGKQGSADRRADFAQAQHASSYLRDLEAVLGDYDRTHPSAGEDPMTETDMNDRFDDRHGELERSGRRLPQQAPARPR